MIKKDRRSFIKNLGIAGATAAILPSTLTAETKHVNLLNREELYGETKPLKIALIGAGGMGSADTNTALRHKNIELVAVCDLYEGRLDDAKNKWGNDLFLTKNYQDVLKRSDIDAVIIGTPDFWHKKISIDH